MRYRDDLTYQTSVGSPEQSWRACPTSVEPRRTLRPRFAGAAHVRVPALVAYKYFLVSYRSARLAWKAGKATVFPPGTYWLAQVAPITVAASSY